VISHGAGLNPSVGNLIRNDAAALATAVKNGFRNLWAQGKYPKVSILEAESPL
jgi:hypothetical protein